MSRWFDLSAAFRPPYGKLTLPMWIALKMRGTSVFWWTIDSGDTHEQLPRPGDVADQVAAEGGGILLMHDFDRSTDRCEFVLKTTELVLETARREGISLRRLGDTCH